MNELDVLIANAFKTPRDTHRILIKELKKKVIDVEDFVESLKTQLHFTPDETKIQDFGGYNPDKEIDALIYNYDKRGWLFIEMATRELYFIDATKYPYPRKILEHREFVEKAKFYTLAGTFIAVMLSILYLLVRCC